MNSPQGARAERKEVSSENIVTQKAEGEEAFRRTLHRDILIFAALLLTGGLLANGIGNAVNASSPYDQIINNLIVANYDVQDSEKIRDTNFLTDTRLTGENVMVTTNGESYECRGLFEIDLEDKKPLTCTGITIQPNP